MAEPLATTAAAVITQSDVLLATKLNLPQTRPGFVVRRRLLDRLALAREGQLILVSAPAGFGKTALLADWARREPRPVAWLTLDDGDNDPARFWHHATAALDRVRPVDAERVVALLGGAQSTSFELVVTALVNELANMDTDVVLVLDDYHSIQARTVHASVGFLLEHLPGCLRLVVSSRADPPLPLARLRARGQLVELRAADLRFTPAEAAELLRTAVGTNLPDSAVTLLADRTEGWVAGLQLAALSLQDHPDIEAFVQSFSGSHRYVLDYLAEEVLDRQPEDLRRFLLETSVLERLSGPLCAVVTGRADSQRLLEQIERANLFLLPLDEVRGWWRYHHLFADLLRARLTTHERPDRVTELHRDAAAWSEANGLIDDAIRHALAAGDATWAAQLIEQHFDALVGRREDATLRRWLEALPAELVRTRPRLCLVQAFWALLGGRVETVERLLDIAEPGFVAVADEPYEPSVGRDASLLANVPAVITRMRAAVWQLRGDPEKTVALARQTLAALHEDEWMLESITRWYLAIAEWLRGEPAAAERAFASMTSSLAQWRTAGMRTLTAWGYYYIGQVQLTQGRLSAALSTYREALAATTEPGRPAMPAAGVAHVGLAAVAYERDELAAAMDHATQGVALSRQNGWSLPLLEGLTRLARLRQTQGDRPGTLDAIGQAEGVQQSDAVVALLNPLTALRAELALANGQVEAAAGWINQRGVAPQDLPSYPREREYLVLARLLLAQQVPEQALGMLERWSALAAAQGRTDSRIRLGVLQVLAHASCGDRDDALEVLAQMLELAAPEGYLRVFLDEGPPMATLLRELLLEGRHQRMEAADVPRDYLARLANAFEQAGMPVRPSARRGGVVAAGLVEPLTERELEVLRLLADGASNRAIAKQLGVTPETVKKHLSHLFDKLDADNRTQAVTRARELRLLP